MKLTFNVVQNWELEMHLAAKLKFLCYYLSLNVKYVTIYLTKCN